MVSPWLFNSKQVDYRPFLLAEEVGLKQKLPQHVAIVMDGNGRWAENRALPRLEGHRAGIKAVKEVVKCCLAQNISILSLFAFSSENWARPNAEVEFLMELFLQALENEISELHEQGVCLRFTGSREKLSLSLRQKMEDALSITAKNQRLLLNIAVNYSGRWEILTAARKLISNVVKGDIDFKEIDESVFAQYLDTAGIPDPDLFIRTSGEQRISNFFLWQLAYTELYFSPLYWPDFNAKEFNIALEAYCARERRFGQTSEQIRKNPALSKDKNV
jgi:undecaprenyl diphosphate synthase